jgi:hypothetical protein
MLNSTRIQRAGFAACIRALARVRALALARALARVRALVRGLILNG